MKIRFTHLRNISLGDYNHLIKMAWDDKQIKSYHQHHRPMFCPQAVTICEVLTDEGATSHGFAFCSKREQFSRARGRVIAKNRALYKLGLTQTTPRQSSKHA